MYHPKTDAYHFRYGDYQGKKTGRWERELHGQIRIKRDGVQVYQESQTFARKQAAQAWARKRELELDEPGAIERASRKGATLKEMTERYLVPAAMTSSETVTLPVTVWLPVWV